jgi:large subunit ribosomal protein L15e
MANGMYHYLKQIWKHPDKELLRKSMIDWRTQDSIVKLEKPTRLDRARTLGYKAKKGYIVARVKLPRGGRQRDRTNKARKPKKHTIRKTLKMSYQWIAEQRAAKYFKNLEVLNSYKLGKDGKYYFFDVILVDPQMPEIKSDRTINWICNPDNRGRAFRGLTSAARKSRGLSTKSRNLKVRPSLSSWNHKGK